MIRVIAARELRTLLASPFGWILAALSQLVLGWRFLQLVEQYHDAIQPELERVASASGVSEWVMAAFFQDVALTIVLLVVVALLGMRVIAEERSQATLPLLLASPAGSSQIVLGKYLGLWLYLMGLVLCWALMPLSLLMMVPVDVGRLLASLLGLAAFASAMLALAAFASTLTRQPGLAAGMTFIFGILLILLGQATAGGEISALAYFAPNLHYAAFLHGVVSTLHLAYFVLFTLAALAFAVRRVDALRVLA